MKAIETLYNGYRFRSRLEARWAVFFDTLGVDYEYEPEGYDLGDGDYYLPDFRVKCWGTRGSIEKDPFDLWIEVKGVMTEEDARKIRKFAYLDSVEQEFDGYFFKPITNSILIVGNIPSSGKTSTGTDLGSYDLMNGVKIYPFNLELVDGDHFGTGFQYWDGKLILGGDDSSYGGTSNYNVDLAYDAARQARFEYGENPKKTKQFFTIEDNDGNKIIIKNNRDDGFIVTHPKHNGDIIIDGDAVCLLLYSLGGEGKIDDFSIWYESLGH